MASTANAAEMRRGPIVLLLSWGYAGGFLPAEALFHSRQSYDYRE